MTHSQKNVDEAKRGWNSSFVKFTETPKSQIFQALHTNYPDSKPSEIDSWRHTVPTLQRVITKVTNFHLGASKFTVILEYELPMDLRRADAVLLLHDNVVVIELKGKTNPTDADIDQVHAYARDLRCYHRECHEREVIPILVLERSVNRVFQERNVIITSPDRLDEIVSNLATRVLTNPIDAQQFLKSDVYKPLPSLVIAARELFNNKRPPQLWRSVANTDKAVRAIREIIADTCSKRKRKLILLVGVPGAGKTLVGLRIAHEADMDKLDAKNESPSSIFLSGNGPLVKVLEYVLETEQGTGSTFVRPIKNYVNKFRKNSANVPNEHVIVFDEAQRAHDRAQTAKVHKIGLDRALSEPEYFVEFAERIPDWSVVIGLVGIGQEINIGEEGGLNLWAEAIKNSKNNGNWEICGPSKFSKVF